VQIRRKGFKKFDKVFADLGQAVAARDSELKVRQLVVKADDITLRGCFELFRESATFDGFGPDHKKKILQNWRLAIADELGELTLAFFAGSACRRRLV